MWLESFMSILFPTSIMDECNYCPDCKKTMETCPDCGSYECPHFRGNPELCFICRGYLTEPPQIKDEDNLTRYNSDLEIW